MAGCSSRAAEEGDFFTKQQFQDALYRYRSILKERSMALIRGEEISEESTGDALIDRRLPRNLVEATTIALALNDMGCRAKVNSLIFDPNIFFREDMEDLIKFVAKDEYYDVLREAHVATNHGNLIKMVDYLSEKLFLMPKPPIEVFLGLCKVCKHNALEESDADTLPSELLDKPVLIHIIDMNDNDDGHYKWLLHYRNLNARTSVLLPLISKGVDNIAYAIFKIFMENGYPTLVYTDGSALITQVVERMANLGPEFRGTEVEHFKKLAINRICYDIKNKIMYWQKDNWSRSVSWSIGVSFIEHQIDFLFKENMRELSEEPLLFKQSSFFHEQSRDTDSE